MFVFALVGLVGLVAVSSVIGTLVALAAFLLHQKAPLQELPRLPTLRARGTVLALGSQDRNLVDGVHVEDLSEGEAECPVCGDEIVKDDPQMGAVYCSACRAPHHEDCWNYVGRCSIYGCGERRSSSSRKAVAALPASFDREACETLHRRFRRWFWLGRLRWWFELAGASFFCAAALNEITLGQIAGPASTDVGFIVSGLIMTLLETFAHLSYIGPVWFAVWVAAMVTESRMRPLLKQVVDVPSSRVPSLFRRVEGSRSRPWLLRLARFLPWVWFLGLAYAVFVVRPVPFDWVALLWALLGSIAVLVLPAVSYYRLHELERLRCTLRGSLRVLQEALPEETTSSLRK